MKGKKFSGGGKMKKISVVLFLIFFSFSSLLKADINSDLDKSLYMSIGSAAAKAAGLPVDEVNSIAQALKNGDFKSAIFNLASWATDNALDLIPVYGQAKFAADLVLSFGNVLMTYLGNEVIKSAWNVFVNLDDAERNAWLKGEYVPEIDGLYGMRLVDKNKMRQMFKNAWTKFEKNKKQSKIYMEYMAKISKLIKRAKERLTPSLFYPSDGAKVYPDTKIELWNAKNNYFKLTLHLPDDANSIKIIKNPDLNAKTTSFTLNEFSGVDWNKYFTTNKEIKVTISVIAGVYDTTGLMKDLMPDIVTPKQNLIKIKDLNDKIYEKFSFSLVVLPKGIKCSGKLSGILYADYTTSEGDTITQSFPIDPTQIEYFCDPNSKKAVLKIIDDGITLQGECDKNGSGSFSIPLQGGIILYLNASCNPFNLSFYSSGSYTQYQQMDDELISVTLHNIRGSLQ